jgi:hypothetical protein
MNWHDQVRSLLDYDQDTGLLTWRDRDRGRLPAGHVAGVSDSHGYIVITIGGRLYKAHRLAWLLVHGSWPSKHLDHANGNRSDNRIANLREADRWQNCANSRTMKRNTSGFKGVYFNKRTQRWMARISANGKRLFLGLFPTPETAYRAYCEAAIRYHGDFARMS